MGVGRRKIRKEVDNDKLTYNRITDGIIPFQRGCQGKELKKFSLKKLTIQELLLNIPHTQGIWSRIGGVRMRV